MSVRFNWFVLLIRAWLFSVEYWQVVMDNWVLNRLTIGFL
jgi:hypothetical protein